MSSIKVFVLTIDSESWLGSEIHSTYEAALQSLVESADESCWPDGEVPTDEETAREWLGEIDTFFCIEEQQIDINQFERSAQ